jgi:hypothetical protein
VALFSPPPLPSHPALHPNRPPTSPCLRTLLPWSASARAMPSGRADAPTQVERERAS